MAKRGRPEHVPTEETRLKVQLLAILGRPHADIAKMIGTGTHQLRRHYREEMDFGKDAATMKVAGALYKNALKGNVTAQIFWLKVQAGWREIQIHEHAGIGGRPIQHAVAGAVSEDDALKAYLQMVSGTPAVGHA